MELYIDKDNLCSMVSSGDNPMFSDCTRMLKNKFDLKFNFKKEEIKDDEKVKKWITLMTDGFKGTVSYLESYFPERPLKSNTCKTFNKEQLSAVYLIDDEKIETLIGMGCFLFARKGNEIEVLSHLIIKDSDYSFDKKIPIKSLKRWSCFDDFLSPCSDIILIDQYILSDQDIYNNNIYSLVKTLAKFANRVKLNIVIVTIKEHYNSRTKTTFIPNWDSIKSNIKSSVKSISNVDPNVTFVLSPADLKEHDRTIFTNYKRIYSGDSFNYFNSSWDVITSGREVHFCSLADKDNYELGFNLINDVQKIINEIGNRNTDLIKGDKESNYLNFK